ncbi:hypothetical protein G9403_09910 [Weissella paramesenteroides]|uniref:ORF6C domain-containing protein n=1 Tax=Weissella paramesenteroides TaxID=1249 RepID=A0ABD4XKW3_WEIPA|nr:Rha family transcriptional regulator [Weissella paramesenteroides]MDF8369903.1 hypothetical protein [Weissella paramesenteroides]MDF8371934.1 hypothetical protein [Weissella paramesenteroides]
MTQTEQLVELQNGVATTTSLQVAEAFDKRHDAVLRDVKSQIKGIRSTDLWSEFFQEDTYTLRGREYPMYRMNKDGFTLLVMGYTGEKATEFKLRYIQAFNEMEQALKNQPALRLPQNNAEMLQVVQNVNEETNKRIDEVENSVSKLTDEFGLPNKSAGKLRNYGNQRVTWWLGGKNTNAYQEISGKVFAEFWHDLKMYFGGLSSYKDLPMKDITQAEAYIQNWHPSTNTQAKISELNSQTELEV